MRDLPTSIASVITQDENKPVELLEIYLDTETFYFAQADDYVVLGTQTYSPFGFSRSAVRASAELEVDEMALQLDNVDLTLAKRVIATDFVGRRVVLKKAVREQLGAGNYVVIFDGRMDEPSLDQSKLTVQVRSWLDSLHQMVPRRMYSTLCNYQHYDPSCTVSKIVGTNLLTGTAIGSSTDSVLVAAVLSGQGDTYWGPIGTLTFNTGSNRNIGREATGSSQSSNSTTVRVPFPFAINSGDVFTLTRGCRKNIDDCINKYSNYVNYGGFPTIPQQPYI